MGGPVEVAAKGSEIRRFCHCGEVRSGVQAQTDMSEGYAPPNTNTCSPHPPRPPPPSCRALSLARSTGPTPTLSAPSPILQGFAFNPKHKANSYARQEGANVKISNYD